MRFKSNTFFLFLASLAAFLFFFIVKCLNFYRSDYTGDIFTHFQLSRDWLLGKPLFYENSYGYHNKFHNYFIDILLAPFTYLMGVYGLFVAFFALIIGALYNILVMLERIGTSIQTKLLFIVFYTSPLTYFILHNEHYGFHVEMLLLPLGLLFTSALLQNKLWYLLWAIFILLVKEDGAAILWSCWAAILLIKKQCHAISWGVYLREFFLMSVACALLFIFGFAWLKHMNNGGETRMGWVMQSLQEQPRETLLLSFNYLVKLRIQLTALVILVIYFYAGWKFTLGAIIISVPILILNFLSGTLYFDGRDFMIKNFFSILWTPRLSQYWAYWLSILCIALTLKPAVYIYPKMLRTLVCSGYGIFVFAYQIYFFRNCFVTRLDLVENIKEAFQPNIEFTLNPEFKDAAAIAKQLPDHYPVAPMYRVFGAFCSQDIIWLNALDNAFIPPRMILASYNKEEVPDVTTFMKTPYFMLYQQRLHIYCEAPDTIFIAKAGLIGDWQKVKSSEN